MLLIILCLLCHHNIAHCAVLIFKLAKDVDLTGLLGGHKRRLGYVKLHIIFALKYSRESGGQSPPVESRSGPR